MQYLYNEKRHTLHIKGYCRHTEGSHPEYKVFESYNDALAYDGNAVSMCKLCEKEKEKRN